MKRLLITSAILVSVFLGFLSEIAAVEYSIINKSTIPKAKCSIEIRLSEKASEEELAALARELKNSHGKDFERVFISYYLPDMDVDSGAWATSHYNPDLKIKILGLTEEQEEALIASFPDSEEDVIGVWLDETPYISNTTKLYRENNIIWILIQFKDGSTYSKELTEYSMPHGVKYEEKGGNSHGEYYVIDDQGILSVYDSEGLIKALKPVAISQKD